MLEFKGLEFAPNFEQKSKGNLAQAQSYIDNQVLKYLPEYVPIAQRRFKNRGKMSQAHKIQKPGLIINTEPKARREYYINKGGSGGKRGKLWLPRMAADHKDDIRRGLNNDKTNN